MAEKSRVPVGNGHPDNDLAGFAHCYNGTILLVYIREEKAPGPSHKATAGKNGNGQPRTWLPGNARGDEKRTHKYRTC